MVYIRRSTYEYTAYPLSFSKAKRQPNVLKFQSLTERENKRAVAPCVDKDGVFLMNNSATESHFQDIVSYFCLCILNAIEGRI